MVFVAAIQNSKVEGAIVGRQQSAMRREIKRILIRGTRPWTMRQTSIDSCSWTAQISLTDSAKEAARVFF